MAIAISLTQTAIAQLDLSPAIKKIEPLLQAGTIAAYEQQFQFEIDFPQDPSDPRELPEIPEIRLWFLRLDAHYPWLLFLLDWKAGELSRYVAMMVPHQFNRAEGIIYNPEALELFVMKKVFVLNTWLSEQGIEGKSRLQAMAQMLGYELEDGFFELL